MKICNTCKEEKSEEDFTLRKDRGTRVARCKACHNAAVRGHYSENKEKYAEKNKRDLPKYRERNREYILNYLRAHPCVDCGESDIEVLQFDHNPPLQGGKRARVLSHNGSSLKRVQEEIDKCEVRCANCHVRQTRRFFGWERT